jgi:hypothetical protein
MTLLQLRADLAALEMRWALAKLAYKYNFNPAQPRVPAGVPGLLFQTACALGWSGRRAARSESFSNMRKRAPSRSCDGKALSILPYPSSVSITFLRKTWRGRKQEARGLRRGPTCKVRLLPGRGNREAWPQDLLLTGSPRG